MIINNTVQDIDVWCTGLREWWVCGLSDWLYSAAAGGGDLQVSHFPEIPQREPEGGHKIGLGFKGR